MYWKLSTGVHFWNEIISNKQSFKIIYFIYSIRYGPFNQAQLREILKEGELTQEFVRLVCWLVKNLKTSINSQQELSGITTHFTTYLKHFITNYYNYSLMIFKLKFLKKKCFQNHSSSYLVFRWIG